ncbi:MAG: immunoglobulin-like domain-containing protein [Suipraeoptans sp.]
MSGNLYFRICAWIKNRNNRNIIIIFVLVVGVGLGILIYDQISASSRLDAEIQRNSYGKGSREEQIEIDIGDSGREAITIEVGEREYTSEEIKIIFDEIINNLDSLILGENIDFDYVTSDLNLIKSYKDYPVTITWRSDNFQLVSNEGRVNAMEESEEGKVVKLSAAIIYTNRTTDQAIYERGVCIYPKYDSNEDAQRYLIERRIKENEEKSKTDEVFTLPSSADGKEISYYRIPNYRGITIMVFGVLFGILLFLKTKQDKIQSQKDREKQMLIDFPEILSKIIMLLGSGMVLSQVWDTIVDEYDRKSNDKGIRFGYEEMKITRREMRNGTNEVTCYENFGKRCKIRPYMRLGMLLSGNIRKGNKGLIEVLKSESYQVYDERLVRAKRAGEEAGTKLLIPMFLMLVVALLVIIVPAFISIQI